MKLNLYFANIKLYKDIGYIKSFKEDNLTIIIFFKI